MLESNSKETLEPWVSSATTEAIYSSASAMTPEEKVRHIVQEEIYKTARPSDSGRLHIKFNKLTVYKPDHNLLTQNI